MYHLRLAGMAMERGMLAGMGLIVGGTAMICYNMLPKNVAQQISGFAVYQRGRARRCTPVGSAFSADAGAACGFGHRRNEACFVGVRDARPHCRVRRCLVDRGAGDGGADDVALPGHARDRFAAG